MRGHASSLYIFEPKWSGGGHHPSWFKELVAQWLRLGHRVTAFCPAPREVATALEGRLASHEFARLSLLEIPDQRDLLGRWAHSPLRMLRVLWMAGVYNRILCAALGKSLPLGCCLFFGLTDLFALRLRGWGRLCAARFSLPFVGMYFFPPSAPPSFFKKLLLDDLGFFRGRSYGRKWCMG